MKFLKTKYLTPFALLIFFMPFLRFCEPLTKYEATEVEAEIDSVAINIDTLKTVNLDNSAKITLPDETQNSFSKSNDFENKEDVNLSAYHIGFGFVKSIYNNEFQLKDFSNDKDFFSIISYTFIIVFSILMIVFSWRRKFLRVRNLAVANIILLVISTILLVKSGVIDEFEDIKYGTYVFIMYSILIIYISNKENLEPKNLKP